eukprot:1081517-Alexandrium_andersonii.AAC.1
MCGRMPEASLGLAAGTNPALFAHEHAWFASACWQSTRMCVARRDWCQLFKHTWDAVASR